MSFFASCNKTTLQYIAYMLSIFSVGLTLSDAVEIATKKMEECEQKMKECTQKIEKSKQQKWKRPSTDEEKEKSMLNSMFLISCAILNLGTQIKKSRDTYDLAITSKQSQEICNRAECALSKPYDDYDDYVNELLTESIELKQEFDAIKKVMNAKSYAQTEKWANDICAGL